MAEDVEVVAVTEDGRLMLKLSELLERTANALKGDHPDPLHQHDWSDLPEVALRLRLAHDAAVAECERLRATALPRLGGGDD